MLQSNLYMYRELSAVLKDLDNVFLMKSKLDSIWMGPNILTELLYSFRVMYENPGLKWDYVLNLDENDFPIRLRK